MLNTASDAGERQAGWQRAPVGDKQEAKDREKWFEPRRMEVERERRRGWALVWGWGSGKGVFPAKGVCP